MLTPRQVRFYKYQVSIWRQGARTGFSDFAPFTLVYSQVPCLYSSAPNVDLPGNSGDVEEIRLPLMHWFSFDLSVDIQGGDRLELTLVPNGSPDLGQWFAVHGDPHRNAYRANRQRVYCLPSTSAS